ILSQLIALTSHQSSSRKNLKMANTFKKCQVYLISQIPKHHLMGLEYDSLADYSLPGSPFYESSTLDIYDMSAVQLSGKLGSTIKRRKPNKRVTFLSQVQ
uniref:CSON013866 protein n=1 Tax=Culicoides sonorensis TaxID=179676 RepID=A0A336M925_CULSO